MSQSQAYYTTTNPTISTADTLTGKDYFRLRDLNVNVAYLCEILVGQQMQLPWFEAVLTFTFVEEVRLEFPTRVFFSGRHHI